MLKRILNKKLLVALVIGSSLGLTNVGICSHNDIVINEVDCFEYEENENVTPIKVPQLVKDVVQQTFGVAMELIGEDTEDLTNCGIGLFGDNFQTKEGAKGLEGALVDSMKDVGYADIDSGNNFVMGIVIKDRKEDAVWLRGLLSTVRDIDGYGVAYRLYESFSGTEYYAALRKSSPEEVSKKSDEVTKLTDEVTKLKDDVNKLLLAIDGIKNSLKTVDKSITEINMGMNQLQLNIDNGDNGLKAEIKQHIGDAAESFEEKIRLLSQKIDAVKIKPSESPIMTSRRKIIDKPIVNNMNNNRRIIPSRKDLTNIEENKINVEENKINVDENKIEEVKKEGNEENRKTTVTKGQKKYKVKRYGV